MVSQIVLQNLASFASHIMVKKFYSIGPKLKPKIAVRTRTYGTTQRPEKMVARTGISLTEDCVEATWAWSENIYKSY